MTEHIVICLFALFGSGLTFFSGFGLGTLLVPVFAAFFPIELAIALTAIVHFLNNIFKCILVGKHANKKIVLRFGLPAILSAFLGAYVLTLISDAPPLYYYSVSGKVLSITAVKLTIAILLFVFSLFELVPKLSKLNFDQKYIPLGGLLSGFFGGLSGNQGALRSAFLLRTNLSKESFIATGVVIAVMIDISRLIVYSTDIFKHGASINYSLLIAASLSAFAGALIGNTVLKKITIKTLQTIVGVMLIIFSILLGCGLI
ncbi:MAG: sulfite exporter TauE/SafE family protein [Bacteroidia bacterium]|nr:sulfite exporter TauE/SafE family protein [Bacteroidia bacterium]